MLRAMGPQSRSNIPGAGLRHPVALLAIGLLIVNDHVLKSAWPGVVTGKLSDVAGLIFFPLLLVAIWELSAGAERRDRAGRWPIVVTAALTAIAFASVKTLPVAAEAFGIVLGSAQWLLGAAAPTPARIVVDPTDLVALPAVLVAIWIHGRTQARGAPPIHGHTRRVLATSLALILATTATVATSGPTVALNVAPVRGVLRVDAEHAAAAQRLTVSISEAALADNPSRDFQVTVTSLGPGPAASPTASIGAPEPSFRLLVSTVQPEFAGGPDPVGAAADRGADPIVAETSTVGFGAGIACRASPCPTSYWVIAQLLDPSAGPLDIAWAVTLRLMFSRDKLPDGATASLAVEAPIATTGDVPMLIARAPAEVVTIGPERPVAGRLVEIAIGGTALTGDGTEVARLSAEGRITQPTPDARFRIEVFPIRDDVIPPQIEPASDGPTDPFADCNAATTCIRRFLVTVSWLEGPEHPVELQPVLRRIDLDRAWSTPAALTIEVVRRWDVAAGATPSSFKVGGEAAPGPDVRPGPLRVPIRTTTSASDPWAAVAPVAGVLVYEGQVRGRDPSASPGPPFVRAELTALIGDRARGVASVSFVRGVATVVANPFAGCGVGSTCPTIAIATVASGTGASTTPLTVDWTLRVLVYPYAEIPVEVSEAR